MPIILMFINCTSNDITLPIQDGNHIESIKVIKDDISSEEAELNRFFRELDLTHVELNYEDHGHIVKDVDINRLVISIIK
jgi:hypothetical protein